MKKTYVLEKLTAGVTQELVLHGLDCTEDSPVYEEFVEEFYRIYPEAEKMIRPVGMFGFGELPEQIPAVDFPAGTKVLYGVLSIGEQLSNASTKAFAEGDCVQGMLYNAIADAALFSLEQDMARYLREICEEHHVGIRKRLEAPQDISMEIQKEIWERLDLKNCLGIDITCGYMFYPVKTSCLVFVLDAEEEIFEVQHDCSRCQRTECRHRNIPDLTLQIMNENGTKDIVCRKGSSLLEVLVQNGYRPASPCGGKGRCGKCKVKLINGPAKISAADEACFSAQELQEGWRLACRLVPEQNMTVFVPEEQKHQILETGVLQKKNEKTECAPATMEQETEAFCFNVAIDIGTTTLVFQLLDGRSGKVLHTVSMLNRQRIFGADVISRIQAANAGKLDELSTAIRTDLKNGMQKLLEESNVEGTKIRRIAIGANTTMVHLLMGYDCSTLGVYPFKAVTLSMLNVNWTELVGSDTSCHAETVIFPGFSAFVGGDIVSGLYACGFDKKEETALLIDLGTNGEMALGNKNHLLVTSTAAGPAFEGGNISCGIGSVAGAICSVTLEKKAAQIKTLWNKPPVGICGTGVVELMAELVREEVVDETGLLEEEYFEDGFPVAETEEGKSIVFTQGDIRELQLAKAAVRAGIEVLLKRYGVCKEQVTEVYVAGGFGYGLNIDKAIAIGMLPEEFREKITAVGNSCIAGVGRFLQEGSEEAVYTLVRDAEEINLAMDAEFQNCYMEAMMFETDTDE